MSNFHQSAFRDRRIRWLDEEMEAGSRYTSTRDQLNDELIANEQSHFDHFEGDQGELEDMNTRPTTSASLLERLGASFWNPLSSPSTPIFDQPPEYDMEQQQPTTSTSAYPAELYTFPTQPPGYMEQPSAFQFEAAPTESTFLESFPIGDASLTYQNDHGELESIRNINVELIESRSRLLGMAFEPGRSGPRLYLDTLTSGTAYPFLRYLYTGSYALRRLTGEPDDTYEDVPTSVLLHCQLYRLAVIYDLEDLKSQAYVNVLRQCEFGCSSPDRPIDLCAAIRFIYEHLRDHDNLIDAIVNYCVSCFLQHRLAEDTDFQQLAYDLRPFHQALCKNSLDRGFENDTASAIVQMPFKPYAPETYASRLDAAATKFDHVFHFHATDEFDHAAKKRRCSNVKSEEKAEPSTHLPMRLRQDSFSQIDWSFSFKDMPREDAREDAPGTENYKLGSKRRASSIANEISPILSGISQLRAAESEKATVEPEFEIVDRPETASASQGSDSDSDEFVKVQHEDSAAVATLPIRTLAPTAAVTTKTEPESDSDSEWSMI